MVSKHASALDKRRPFLIWGDLFEGLAHDCNNQIQEGDVGDECRQKEHDPDHCRIFVAHKGINPKLAEAEQVLIDDSVQEWVAKNIVDDLASTSDSRLNVWDVRMCLPVEFVLHRVQIQDVEPVSEAHQNDKEENDKGFSAFQSTYD